MLEEISSEIFSEKNDELQERLDTLKLQVEAEDRQREENADMALKTFELSQSLAVKWVTSDTTEKRQILEILCLNIQLNDVSLCPTMTKPFEILLEGPFVHSSRGERI